MEPDRWQRLWAAFHAALERAPGEERAAFVRAAGGGDDAFARELDSLLAAHDDGAELLSPEAARLAGLAATELAPGARVGPYRITRLIGAGGMGLVYEAAQEAPVRRRVALKLIKLGMDTREVVLRFEAERQALASMEHGSIARVFDAGATPEGRPYFAMELIDGPSITDYCDRERLPIARRLELLVAVCRAVHHAHQKGVIHRDLKPSNVLVANDEGRPVPKVIDFGVARAIEDRSMGGTHLTRLGQVVGTPESMSPEQAAMSADVDTRTDVYSLGALLYELVSGAPPFDRHAADNASLSDLLRRIRDEEPPPPSVRFARDTVDADRIAERRGTEPARLRRELAGELDWIVARAMAKERDRRYGSAAELADELERHLAGRPVAAGPPSRFYRFRKLVARNRLAAAASAALLAALILFGLAMAIQARRLARALASEARERATATQVSDFLAELLEQPNPAVARGSEPTVREALDRGAAKIESELAGQPEIQARLLETIAHVDIGLGLYDAAEPLLRRALELRRRLHGPESAEVAADLFHLGEIDFERARYEPARARAEEALALRRRRLGDGHPDVARSLHLVALVERQTGDLDVAERLHRQALAIERAALPAGDPAIAESQNYLGIVRRRRGDLQGAERAYREALATWRAALGDDHPKVAMAMNNLALTVHLGGDYVEARRLFEELLPLRRRLLGDDHPDVQLTLANYAKLLHDARELEAAARVYAESMALGERVLGGEHPQLAATMADYGSVLAKLGRLDRALELEERALAIRRRVYGAEHSTVAASLAYLAEVRAARGERAAAARLFDESVALFRRTEGESPRTAEALLAAGAFRLEAGDVVAAEARLREGLGIARARLPADDRRVARLESALGACLGRAGRFDEGEALLAASLAKLAAPANPDTADARARLEALRAARAGAR